MRTIDNRFYIRMAANNMLLNRRFYIPYLLTCVIATAMFFIVLSMSLTKLPGGGAMAALMQFGAIIIAFFAAVFLFYTNSFLMKRRRRELALYNILGLEKRHIALVLFYETLFCALIAVLGGLLFGVALNKLMYAVLLGLMRCSVTQSFRLYPEAFAESALLFAAIFLLILLFNMKQIVFSSPIELLLGQAAGEREPKVKWPLVVIGAGCLGAGYYIAVTTTDVMTAIALFFAAVMLVIIGTYCLFTAGSIAILKALKKRKSYYYQPRHFISVSGMLYRMKQNAVGLANICILSTMVLVTLSTTVCLYAGIDRILNEQFPPEQRADVAQSFYSLYGSFLFLGLFLGGLFLMATVLIIYYKQLAEGYEDKGRFAIMQKVGLDSSLAKKSIHSQILTMFFLPLITAVIHLCFAFPLLRHCLSALYLNDVRLFLLSTAATVLVFSLIYTIVYAVTAKTYYRIVSRPE